MKAWRTVAVFVILWYAVSPAYAQDDNVFWNVMGSSDSCGKYISAVEAEQRARPKIARSNEVYSVEYIMFSALTDGFLSGANLEDATHRFVGEFTDTPSRMLWLENFCRSNPLSSFIAALIALRRQLIIEQK